MKNRGSRVVFGNRAAVLASLAVLLGSFCVTFTAATVLGSTLGTVGPNGTVTNSHMVYTSKDIEPKCAPDKLMSNVDLCMELDKEASSVVKQAQDCLNDLAKLNLGPTEAPALQAYMSDLSSTAAKEMYQWQGTSTAKAQYQKLKSSASQCSSKISDYKSTKSAASTSKTSSASSAKGASSSGKKPSARAKHYSKGNYKK